MDPDLLKKRIEELYLAHHPETETKHGAQKWFAQQVGRDPRSVWRWVHGKRTPEPPTLKLLECLEREAGIS